jgi:hypothetical protein
VSSTTAIIAGAISANSVQAAPVALAKTVTAVAILKGSIATAPILTLVEGTMKMMTWLKLKFAIGVSVAVLLAGGVATVALSSDNSAKSSSVFQMRLVSHTAARDTDAMVLSTTNQETGKVFRETLHVQKKTLLDHSAMATALVTTNALGGRQIEFTLTETGKEQFAKLTRENIGRRLAIIVDGQVLSAPTINSEISDGQGQISGNFTEDEAKNLAAKINNPGVK